MIKVSRENATESAGVAGAIGAVAVTLVAAAREAGHHDLLERVEKMGSAILPAGTSRDGAFVDDWVSAAASDLPGIAEEMEARLQVAAQAKQ